MKAWYLYMDRCPSGALYTGITTDVEKRIAAHNSGNGAKAIKALGRPVKLVYTKKAGSKSEALKMEARIKKFSKREKEALI